MSCTISAYFMLLWTARHEMNVQARTQYRGRKMARCIAFDGNSECKNILSHCS